MRAASKKANMVLRIVWDEHTSRSLHETTRPERFCGLLLPMGKERPSLSLASL
jgi:hypothetical protein